LIAADGGDHPSGGRDEPIPHPADGLERRRARAELPSDRADGDLDDVAPAGVVGAPDIAQDGGAADDLARSLEQVVEQLEL
jgi:hypothetical protein